jgi:succinate dehydrogenase / fumarate reductase flavoprotein subunit
MGRTAQGLRIALEKIPALREQFWRDVRVLGSADGLNQSLEKAGRVGDFLELGELLCRDALERNESCGGHFREEYQTPDGEALRNDADYSYAAAWEYGGEGKPPALHKEPLHFDYVHPSQRSYKPAQTTKAAWCVTTLRTSIRRCHSWRCSTFSMKA